MPSRCDQPTHRLLKRRTVWIAGLVALVVLVPIGGVAADVISTGQFVVLEGDTQEEDAYVAASSGNVAGTVDGDLVIATPRLTISGVVTGDVLVASQGTVTVSGRIDGSLRGAAVAFDVSGTVGDDIVVAAVDITVTGEVGRDVVVLGNGLSHRGAVGRDVLGRARMVEVAGEVGRDVDMAVDTIEVVATGSVGGDVVYRSSRPVVVADDAFIGGQVIDLPTRAPFFVNLVLRLVLLLGVLGFLVLGVVVLAVFRGTAEHAFGALVSHPWRSLLVGVGLGVVVPLVVALLTATLVGIPLAVVLLVGVILALLGGAIPVVTVVGARLLSGRGGAVGGFLLGGLLWVAAMLLLPVVGAVLGVLVVALGTGAWVLGAWSSRDPHGWPTVPVRGDRNANR